MVWGILRWSGGFSVGLVGPESVSRTLRYSGVVSEMVCLTLRMSGGTRDGLMGSEMV